MSIPTLISLVLQVWQNRAKTLQMPEDKLWTDWPYPQVGTTLTDSAVPRSNKMVMRRRKSVETVRRAAGCETVV